METLETERLILRPFKDTDAASITVHIGNYDVAKMLSRVPFPYARSDAAWFINSRKEIDPKVARVFAIEIKDGPTECVGAIGVHGEDEPDGVAELGYWLGAPYWGQGLVSEGVSQVIRFAFEELGLDKIVAGHFEGNEGSRKILLKHGFIDVGESKRESRARGEEVRCLDLHLTRDMWEAR